jgi:uncharacterized protein
MWWRTTLLNGLVAGAFFVALTPWALAQSGEPSASPAGPTLWRVTDADSTLYIFGTIHIVPEDVVWLTPAIRAALGDADRVWTEVDLSGVGSGTMSPELRSAFARHAVTAPDVAPLTSRLSPASSAKLVERYAALGVPRERYERFRPWMAALTFSIAEAAVRPASLPPARPNGASAAPASFAGVLFSAEANAVSSAVIDRDGKTEVVAVREDNAVRLAVSAAPDVLITQNAVSRGIDRRYLETIEQQLQFYSRLSPPEEIAMLEGVLKDPDMSWNGRGGQSLTDAWASGNLSEVTARVADFTGGDTSEFGEVFIRKRNREWLPRLDEAMKGSGTDFVAVGVAHTVGRDSLPDLLRAAGYVVERV